MTNGNYYNFTNIVPTAIKLWRMVTYLKGILALPRSRDKKTHCRQLYLPYQRAYSHKTSHNETLLWWAPTYTFNWSFDHVVLQDHVINEKHYIFNTTVPMAPNLVGWWFTLRGSYSCSYLANELRDELKTLYLYYFNTYFHQTWQGRDIPWGALTHKVTWSLNHMVL